MTVIQRLPQTDEAVVGGIAVDYAATDPTFLATARRIAALMGPGAGDSPEGSRLSAFLRGIGGGVATVSETVQRAFAQAFAGEATDLLSGLEYELGLPDGSALPTATRQTNLLAKIRAGFSGSSQDILAAVRTIDPTATLVEYTRDNVVLANYPGAYLDVFRYVIVVSSTTYNTPVLVAQIQGLCAAMQPAHTVCLVTDDVGPCKADGANGSTSDRTICGN